MNSPFFSICVPTRNRHETLPDCLRTIVNQDFEDYEIIVSDNSDAGSAVINKKNVEDLKSKKITYYKQETVLSMNQNFEFIVSRARGEYIMILGDDDAMVVNSLQRVFNIIRKTNSLAIKCVTPFYYWPGSVEHPASFLNYPRKSFLREVYSREALIDVARFTKNFFDLPMIYYGFIHRSIIEKVASIQNSVFGNSASPDVYSGFFVSFFSEKFLVTDFPFSIAGISRKSNSNNIAPNQENPIMEEHKRHHNLEYYYQKHNIPFIYPHHEIFIWQELSKFKEAFKIPDTEIKIDYTRIFINEINKKDVWYNVSELGNIVDTFESHSTIYKKEIEKIRQKYFNNVFYYPSFLFQETEVRYNQPIDLRLFGVKNIFDASELCNKLLVASETHEPIIINYRITKKQKIKKYLRRFKLVRIASGLRAGFLNSLKTTE